MARNILCAVLLCFMSLVAWADDRVLLTEEDERRWNTPPELIPEQVMKTPDAKNGRSLSIPITTNINVNTGNNAHSLSFQVSPEGASYFESSNFGRPLSQASGANSYSQSVSFSAGLTGISGAVSQHYPIYGNQGNVNRPGLGFGGIVASVSGSIQNIHAGSTASSTVASIHSSASSNVATIGLSQGTTVRFPGQSQSRPVWTNIRPNHNNNGHPSRMPKLDIEVKPHDEQNRGPIKLHISTNGARKCNNQPKIHIHKWQPTYGGYDDDEQR
ncbi:hypothetical protein WN48_03571 [Eufriesea mexicana]|uniref:uncharacterized protein LOC108549471 n=1 Tax=Eufriesea mexicana TaxID=516756 RepID=UPI00083C6275|nr:PREDICTED: uncharacterized protein LOC108549471 [Eufriesea mexicana]OAD56253.1 hypothetical protein WN48_03571 [Eufriesea mexicana]